VKASMFWRFPSADDAVVAARKLRELGFCGLEAYTPYEVRELEPFLGIRRTRIARVALSGGAVGALFAYGILWYCNAYDFPINVGGRPMNSLPADVPIVFETTVLFSALSIFFTTLVRSGLPRLHRPVFELAGFERASIDEYWVGVDAHELDGEAYARARVELGEPVQGSS
jgi:Protein of unknown function (DUF3341)